MAKPRAVRFLKEITNQYRPSIIFLSEILVKQKKIEKVCKQLGFAGCCVVDAQGHGGGLALLWKNNGGVQVLDRCSNFIDFEVVHESLGRWRYTGYYGYPERSRRVDSWNLIRELAGRSSLPWCIIGDFNDLMVMEEKKGGRSRSRYLLEGFSEALMDCGLVDLGYTGEKYTWERARGTDKWVQERLDRGLANKEWLELFPGAEVRVLEVSTSDHLPLFLQLNRKVYVQKTRRFKFENMWIRKPECRSIIQECWSKEGVTDILDKMLDCCAKLEEWGGGMIKEMRLKLAGYRKELRKFRSRRDKRGIQMYNLLRWEYLRLLEKQEIYWKQRAKQFWLREGDRNTRFFHKHASVRKEINKIVKLKDDQGVWRETDTEIQKVITDYFDNIFRASSTNDQLSDRDKVQKVSDEQNESLVAPVTDDEVKDAVFSMHKEKAPGLDGLNPAFFQTYWHIVGGDVSMFCRKFFETGEIPRGVNSTLVCLIPKIKQPKQMTDLRPISLCNVLMRILSKVMANRMKPCLKDIISDKQSAFIEGRLLTDNALIAFEINHYIKRKTQGKSGVAGLKIDVSKAYDRLEWTFIEQMMAKFGFHSKWVDRIMTCITTVSYSFLHNGEVFSEVIPQRGVRQGDPISPYLYILCAEGLSASIRKYEETNLIHGCKVARGAPSISHLLFADDCYFFFRASQAEASIMKDILVKYEGLSGQAINYNKSSVIFSPNTSDQARMSVCEQLQVQEIDKPGKYLGMPMYVGQNKNETFGFLSDRIEKRLQGWSTKELSKEGKLLLLKSAAQTIPNFWMSLFLIPVSLCECMERKMNAFWWGHGQARKGVKWMAWDRLCMPKAHGGLGVRNLKSFNLAMLAKQGWRILNESNPLVTAVMKARYFPTTDFLNAQLGSNPSYVWRSIMSAQEAVRNSTRRKIGDGLSTNIWGVQWLPDATNGCLTTSMPHQLRDSKVQGLMNVQGEKWDMEILRDVCNERDVELILRIPIPINKRPDTWFWMLEDNGRFSVRSCYRWMQGEYNSAHTKFWKRLWSLNMPGKVINFLWRVCRGCVPTMQALQMKRVNVSANCPWCYSNIETDIHVLFMCDFARTVWLSSGLQQLIQVTTGCTTAIIIENVFEGCTREQCVLFGMICWGLWNRRNNWVWEKVNGSAFGVKASAMNLLQDWREAQRNDNIVSMQGQVRVWSVPPVGWVKANVDAATFQDGTIGVGCVIRDMQGQFVSARCRRVAGAWRAREAEAIGMKEAMSWVKGMNITHCMFETDSKTLAEACNGHPGGENFFGTIVSDCIHIMKHIDHVLVGFVYRSANTVAHALAKAACSMSDMGEWHVTPPSFIHDVLQLDIV